jgi:transcriptional regulator with PAS, ATPase and Fis domain
MRLENYQKKDILLLTPTFLQEESQKLSTFKKARETAEKNAVHRALALSGNNISQAAKPLSKNNMASGKPEMA